MVLKNKDNVTPCMYIYVLGVWFVTYGSYHPLETPDKIMVPVVDKTDQPQETVDINS